MHSDSGDRSQQSAASTFPVSLYPNRSIWIPSAPDARDTAAGPRASDENQTASSTARNGGDYEADWGSRFNAWKADLHGRPVSTSPSRKRNGSVSHPSSFQDPSSKTLAATAAAATVRASYAARQYPEDPTAVASASVSASAPTPAAARGLQGNLMYAEASAALPTSREPALSPARQRTQASAAVKNYHRAGHVSSQSLHSQTQLAPDGNTKGPFTTRNANQRAYHYNNRVYNLSAQFSQELAIDITPQGPAPARHPFHFNPGTQPWVDGGSGLAYAASASVLSAQQPPAVKSQAPDRGSPGPSYRLDSNDCSPWAYQPGLTDVWATARPTPREPRLAESRRRNQAQPQYVSPGLPSPFAPSPCANRPGPYSPTFLGPFHQDFRHQQQHLQHYHHPLLASYNPLAPSAAYPFGIPFAPSGPSRDQDPSKGMRSALLDEFRQGTRSNRRYDLKDIYDHVVEFSGDQHGSRFIQQKLEMANSDEKGKVFGEIAPNAVQLMKDVFGNYVVQKFFEHGDQVQKKVLADKMRGKVVDLSLQVYACRVVQKALEHVLVEQQRDLIRELEDDVLRVIRDQNGNHVVQKVIELLAPDHFAFIMRTLRGQVSALATHTYGCRVVQRMLERASGPDKADILTELHAAAPLLITDQYGNYVVQHVIQNSRPDDRDRMIDLVLAQLLTLSKHKFASNVVEKCIEHGSPANRTNVRLQFTAGPDDGGALPLAQMMRDQYGNYVIQKLLVHLAGTEKEAFVEDIKPQFLALKNGNTRQLQALERLLIPGPPANAQGKPDDAAPTPTHTGADSTTDTPVLTNETNSPQSVSPQSAHASALGITAITHPAGEEGKPDATLRAMAGGAPAVAQQE